MLNLIRQSSVFQGWSLGAGTVPPVRMDKLAREMDKISMTRIIWGYICIPFVRRNALDLFLALIHFGQIWEDILRIYCAILLRYLDLETACVVLSSSSKVS